MSDDLFKFEIEVDFDEVLEDDDDEEKSIEDEYFSVDGFMVVNVVSSEFRAVTELVDDEDTAWDLCFTSSVNSECCE